MPIDLPPMPGAMPGSRGYRNELFFPCPFPGCSKRYKEEGDREMHVMDHYVKPTAARDNQLLARKAIGGLTPTPAPVAPITPEFSPPPKRSFFGRQVA